MEQNQPDFLVNPVSFIVILSLSNCLANFGAEFQTCIKQALIAAFDTVKV